MSLSQDSFMPLKRKAEKVSQQSLEIQQGVETKGGEEVVSLDVDAIDDVDELDISMFSRKVCAKEKRKEKGGRRRGGEEVRKLSAHFTTTTPHCPAANAIFFKTTTTNR